MSRVLIIEDNLQQMMMNTYVQVLNDANVSIFANDTSRSLDFWVPRFETDTVDTRAKARSERSTQSFL